MSRPETVVRRAGPDDARAIAETHVRGWLATYRGHVPDAVLDGLSVDRRATLWAAAVIDRGHAHAVWVAERSETVVGFVELGEAPDPDVAEGTGRVFTIYVDPVAVRSGVGRALIARATRELRAGGLARAVLWVMSSNDGARRFYEAVGWKTDGAVQTEQFGEAVVEEVRYAIDLRATAPVTGPPPAS